LIQATLSKHRDEDIVVVNIHLYFSSSSLSYHLFSLWIIFICTLHCWDWSEKPL